MHARARSLAGAAAIAAIAASCYLGPLLRAGWIWDDDWYVVNNTTLETLSGLRAIWLDPSALPQYYPMVHTTFWIERHLFGPAPLAFHLTNLALHVGTAILLWVALRRLAVPGAWLAGAVFAVHPVHVESVAWVTERKNVLSALFYVSAALCFIRFLALDAREGTRAEDDARPWRLYAAGATLFVAALLSKTVTATLPAAVLLLVWWKKDRVRIRDAAPFVPLLALGAVSGSVTAWIERHHVGAEGDAWNLSVVERSLIAGRALWFYAAKLVWPSPLAFVYPRWRIDATAVVSYAWPAAAVAAVLALWALRGRLGKGPLVGALFFAGTLVPALGFFNVFPMRYSFVADHFQYLASIGLIAVFSAGIATLGRRVGVPRLGWAITALILGALMTATWRQAWAYRDAQTLWTDTLTKNPSALAHNNLGLILTDQGRIEDALAHFRESIRLEPAFVEPRLNLASTLTKAGRADEALPVLEDAVRVRPDHAEARCILGTALAKRGRYEDAVVELAEAVRLDPAYVEAQYNLGTALLFLQRPGEAVPHFETALRVNPDHAGSHLNLARALDLEGRHAEAQVHRDRGERLKASAPKASPQGRAPSRETAPGPSPQ